MLGLLSGLKLKVLLMRSKPSDEQLVNHYLRLIGLIFDSKSSISFPKSVLRDFKSDIVGGPVH